MGSQRSANIISINSILVFKSIIRLDEIYSFLPFDHLNLLEILNSVTSFKTFAAPSRKISKFQCFSSKLCLIVLRRICYLSERKIKAKEFKRNCKP